MTQSGRDGQEKSVFRAISSEPGAAYYGKGCNILPTRGRIFPCGKHNVGVCRDVRILLSNLGGWAVFLFFAKPPAIGQEIGYSSISIFLFEGAMVSFYRGLFLRLDCFSGVMRENVFCRYWFMIK